MASHRKYTPPPAPVPEVKIDGTATAPDAAVSVELPDAAHAYQKEVVAADEASNRLRQQLDDIKKSEDYQRQHHAHTHAMNQLAEHASRTAAEQGHPVGSAEHLNRAREIFSNYLQGQAQAAAAPQSTPQPFPRSSPSPSLPEPPPDRSSLYSAPPSRGEIGHYQREPSPSSVRLTPDELAIASASGISPVEYARNKLKMLREQASGDRQR